MYLRTLLLTSLVAFTELSLASPTPPRPAKRVDVPSPLTTFPVTLSLSAPSSQQTVARSLISFSIEGDRWPDWAGTASSANSFFINCLNNLAKLTGRQPEVRVGANSEDHTTLDESVNVISAVFPGSSSTTPYPEASSVRVSSEYYDLSANMPSGTSMIWGVNLGSNSTANAVAEAKAIAATFASGGAANAAGITLESIEIGNEADLYHSNGLRSSSWTFGNWATQWETFASDVISAAGLVPNTAPRLLLGSFAESSHSSTGFSPQGLIAKGLLSGTYGQYIDTVSQHHYSGSFCSGSGGLLSALMNKASIRGNITQFSSDISAVVGQGRTYILGETNSYSCHGAPGVSDTAGAALWALDYALQAAAQGVRRVYFHEGVGFKYDLIQPVTLTRNIETGATLSTPLAPHVQPQYYAAIVAASFIGNSNSNTVSTYIAELSINNGNVAGYAAYDNGVLSRLVFINSLAWFASSTGTRGYSQLTFNTSGSATKPSSMQVRRLAMNHADDTSGLTFAGRTYETSTGLPSGTDTFTTQTLGDILIVHDSEAVLVTFVY